MALNLICSYGSDVESCGSDYSESFGSPSNESVHTSDYNLLESFEKEVGTKASIFGIEDGSSSDGEQTNQCKDNFPVTSMPLSVSLSFWLTSSDTSRRLPSAGSILEGKNVSSSIFSSEREREDYAQVLTLSQHVPLSEKVETKKKPLCRAFTRGKCRRGDKCRFAHPVASVVPKDAATIAAEPRMYNADDVFAKKPKIA